MRIDGPRHNDDVIVSELISPSHTLKVYETTGYDAEHDAWRVSVCAIDFRQASPIGECWVRSRKYSDQPKWIIYAINTPLPAKVTS